MIYIIRHGQTEKNKANLLQGRSDVPLNDIGKEQAEVVRDHFMAAGIHFDKVYSSPLIRAVQTAEILTGNSRDTTESSIINTTENTTINTINPPEVIIDDRLIEMDYGPYEGMDLRNPAPEVMTFFRDFVHNPAPEGMEPLEDVVSRLGEFLEEIKEDAKGQNVLISTHAIAMKGALEYLTPQSKGSYWSKYIGNCAVYTAEVKEDNWTVPYEIDIGDGKN